MNYEPGAPSVECFFLRLKRCSTCDRIFEVDFALKSRGFGDFGSPSRREESLKSVVRITYEAKAVLAKFIRPEHCVKT
jgi:hypothetical protein